VALLFCEMLEGLSSGQTPLFAIMFELSWRRLLGEAMHFDKGCPILCLWPFPPSSLSFI